MRILFQGDSVTDAGRKRDEFYDLGIGYAKYASELIREAYPDAELEFINRGIGGNRTAELLNRWDEDAVDLKPDVISILVGINDTWRYYETGEVTTHEAFEKNYRTLLERIKNETAAKLIMLEQFLLPDSDKEHFRDDIEPKIRITRKLAREYADVFVPLDGLFAAACVREPSNVFTSDGVHPIEKGKRLIAKHYFEAFKELDILK